MGQDNDIIVWRDGSITLLRGVSPDGDAWLADHLPDDCPRLGDAYAIEWRYVDEIIEGARNDGMVVQ